MRAGSIKELRDNLEPVLRPNNYQDFDDVASYMRVAAVSLMTLSSQALLLSLPKGQHVGTNHLLGQGVRF